VIASSLSSVMAVRSSDHLRRRHKGYLRSDLLAATLRSNREVDVFVLHTARQEIFSHSPTHRTIYSGVHKVRQHLCAPTKNTSAVRIRVRGRPCVCACRVRGHHMHSIPASSATRTYQGSNHCVLFFLLTNTIPISYSKGWLALCVVRHQAAPRRTHRGGPAPC
jgi:hypothetical protein